MRDTMKAVLKGEQDWAGVVFGTTFIDVVMMAYYVTKARTMKVSTAGVGRVDVERLEALDCDVRLWVCYAIVKMNQKWLNSSGKIGQDFGDRLRMHRSHAKMAVIRGEEGIISILTTANLTRNYRWETYFISSSPELAQNLEEHLADIDRVGSEPWKPGSYYCAAHARMFGCTKELDEDLMDLVERLAQ
jgi:hypothetical protein